MSIEISINNECRIVPVRFDRGIDGVQPDKRYPFIDDRGFNHNVPKTNGLKKATKVRGAVVGMAHSHEIEIKLVRENIAQDAPLFVTTSDDSVFSIVTPAQQDVCPDGNTNITIQSTEITGSKKPKTATLEVRFDSIDGPIISTLLVYVFPTILVNIRPYLVAISGQAKTNERRYMPLLDTDRVGYPYLPINEHLNKYFYNMGIQLEQQPTVELSVEDFASEGTLKVEGQNKFAELKKIQNSSPDSRDADSICMYFVNYLEQGEALACSARRPPRNTQITQSCVVIGLHDLESEQEHDHQALIPIIAHEIGHFLGLHHPFEKDNPQNRKQDSWTIRSLMHPTTEPERELDDLSPHPEANNWHDFNFMQGVTVGGFIPMKDVFVKEFAGRKGLGSEAQCSAMRNFVAKKGRKLYR